MGKKENLIAFHRENIINAATEIFYKKGFEATTIEDISKKAEYSRRTIYTYFKNKEEILQSIVLNGLIELKITLSSVIIKDEFFIEKFYLICNAMKKYHQDYYFSFNAVEQTKTSDIDMSEISQIALKIFSIGSEINKLLESYIKGGIDEGMVLDNINIKATVYILWANISSLITLTETKGKFISKELSMTEDNFYNYGFTQILNIILKERL